MQLLSEGRFTLGLGAGEHLNEPIVGGGWPLAGLRTSCSREAVALLRALWAGATVTSRGEQFDVESATVWDLPDTAPPVGIAVSGPGSCRLAGRHADAMIATEPRAELGRMFDHAGGSGKPRIGQIALSDDPSGRPRSSGRWSSSAGSPAAGASTPSSRSRRRLRWRPGRCASRTWPRRCRAVPTSGGTSPGSASSRRQGSPTSRWSKSAQTPNRHLTDTQEPCITWAATHLLPTLRTS